MNLLLVIVVFIFTFTGCGHKVATSSSVIKSSDFLGAGGTQQITFLGFNERPRFSKDGLRLLFQSRLRPSHRGSQIYEYDSLKNKERRITFSDGDAFDPFYMSDEEFLYSSTTDEIKETPWLKPAPVEEFPASDIYMSDLYGTNILRLVRQPGYDGESLLLSHPKQPAVFFTSKRGELFGIYRLDLKSLPVSLVSGEKDHAKMHPTLTPEQTSLVWVDTDLLTQKESLVSYDLKTKIPTVLKSGEGHYQDLSFAPNPPLRLFYSIQRKGDKKFQIEVLNLETSCTQIVFKDQDSLTSPVVNSFQKERIAFVRRFQESSQIYTSLLPSDLGPCLESGKRDTLKE